jgi:hypothetical protein
LSGYQLSLPISTPRRPAGVSTTLIAWRLRPRSSRCSKIGCICRCGWPSGTHRGKHHAAVEQRAAAGLQLAITMLGSGRTMEPATSDAEFLGQAAKQCLVILAMALASCAGAHRPGGCRPWR